MYIHLLMSISLEQKSSNRAKILSAASRCFIRHGFHATGMAEISKACRMSAGNLYHYFRNKEAIVEAIADESRSRMLPALLNLEAGPDPLKAIVEIVVLCVGETCRDSNARLWIEISAEGARNRAVCRTLLAIDRDIRSILERLMKKAASAGKIPRSTNAHITSLWLIALIDGAIARMSLEPHADLRSALAVLARELPFSLSNTASLK